MKFSFTKGVFIFTAFLLCFALPVQAKPVSAFHARVAAHNQFAWVMNVRKGATVQSSQVVLAYQEPSTVSADPLYYVFVPASGKGFVIIAGDDAVQPVLAWSDNSMFSTTNQAPAYQWFVSGYAQSIEKVRSENISASLSVQRQWTMQLSGDVKRMASIMSVPPVDALVKTTWNQGNSGTPYNDLCPMDKDANERTVTGCVATSFAQILKYHGKPAQGSGYSKYTHAKYGTLEANYGATQYNWDIMPMTDSASKVVSADAKLAIATLMYHCGVSIEMNYDVAAKGGSGALTSKIPVALTRYFGYKNTAREIYKKDFTDATWLAAIKAELDAKRPVEYGGSGKGGGHSFLCDGYDASDKLHMNWGWGGYQDGFYAVNNLVPGSGGTGSGSGSYNDGQDAVIGIEPDTSAAATNKNKVVLNSNIFVNKNDLSRTDTFEITVAFTNTDAADFKGDYVVLMLDSAKNVVDTLSQLKAQTIAAGTSTANIKFTAITNSVVTPGTYFITFGTSVNNAWASITETAQFKNNKALTITKPVNGLSELGLNAAITLNATQIRIGTPVTVNVDATNFSTLGNVFSGDVTIDLLTTNGTKIMELGKKTIADLAVNAKIDGGVTATWTPADNLKPGRYLIAANAKITGQTAIQQLDWRGFVNPITINVAAAPLKDDKLEPNNTKQTASPLSFVTKPALDSIVVDSVGFNNYQDIDYYKIDFPAATRYLVTVSIVDMVVDDSYTGVVAAYCDFMGKTGVFVDSKGSEVVNDTVTGPMYVEVEPFYIGQEGTYKLVVLYRSIGPASVNEDKELTGAVRLTPVPARTAVTVTAPPDQPMNALRVVNVLGETVLQQNLPGGANRHTFSVAAYNAGTYFAYITCGDKVVVKQFVVAK